MKLILAVRNWFLNTTIRKKLLLSFIVASSIMCFVVIYIIFIFSTVVNSVAIAYRSNAKLDEYSMRLAEMEASLEQYIKIGSFDSIDSYYRLKGKIEGETALIFATKPQKNEIILREYSLTKLVESFIHYADAAVAARRANNIGVSDMLYTKAGKGYKLINANILTLGNLYFQRNIQEYKKALENLRSVSFFCILIVVLMALLDLLFVYMLVNNITQPLEKISNVANKLADREFDIPLLSQDTNDEVGNICRAFNGMIISIREYIDTIWEKAEKENELRKKEMEMASLYKDAQLKALQSQINPHFLFNTLNTGAQLAMLEDADKTSYFITQVADFFRHNIQQNSIETTLENELSLIDNYVYIMKMRFGSKLSFEKIINCASLGWCIPTMVLQPIVENCIRHGLKNIDKGGIVKLYVSETEKNIEIIVSDNGSGVPPEIRAQLLDENAAPLRKKEETAPSEHGVGLFNVISRLRLFYSDASVFDILQNEGGGACFVLRLPKIQ
ncbi:MAG: histidine kinase [Spirochaetales bacterium]|nr:histidine kinase [Spirochaetales bacterium]